MESKSGWREHRNTTRQEKKTLGAQVSRKRAGKQTKTGSGK